MSLCTGSWQVNSAICGCPAGRGPCASCKHIRALCYALANFCLFGKLPEFLTCTDVKQAWNRPASKKHKPITVDQIKLTRREILSKPSGAQPIPSMYDPRPISLRVVTPQNSENLRLRLLETDHSCAILQQLIPSTIYSKHDHTYCRVDLERLSDPPPTIDPVAVSPFPTITTQQRHSVLLKLSVTASESLKIESSTRNQSDSPFWNEVRAKRITGFKCGKILCQGSKTDAILKSVLYPTPMINKPAPIKWGVENEKLARSVYV